MVPARSAEANVSNTLTVLVDIDKVLRGYLTAALWTSQGEDVGFGIPETSGEFDPSPYIDRFTKAAREEALTDCAAFVDANNADLCDDTGEPIDPDQIGHDLWLTRNREGAGFWDREYLPKDQAERLTNAAEPMHSRRVVRVRGGRYVFEST